MAHQRFTRAAEFLLRDPEIVASLNTFAAAMTTQASQACDGHIDAMDTAGVLASDVHLMLALVCGWVLGLMDEPPGATLEDRLGVVRTAAQASVRHHHAH